MELCKAIKPAKAGNPISPDIYCADPTAAEYQGRLYVFGTNDHQQRTEGKTGSNTYEAIRSFVVFSTDDMVNWIYHGTINTAAAAPWIISSWAPSVAVRREKDGLTHFYLYFSNNGCGVGVITATDPLGPWSDPLGRPLIAQGMPGLGDVPNPFDPGVCIDGNGTGWLTFGGGRAQDGTPALPGTARIVRLGDDMLSFAGGFSPIPAPYFYEASELNIIGSTFCYTYNTSWEPRESWNYPGEPPTRCAMSYMTAQNPLDPGAWVYRADYLANPGDSGYPDSNNHTHLHKFRGQWYLFYHTLQTEQKAGDSGGFRSLCVTPVQVDEQHCTIERAIACDAGAPQIAPLDPYAPQSGLLQATHAGIGYVTAENGAAEASAAKAAGAWLCVRGADFGEQGAGGFSAILSGSGTLSVYADAPDGECLCTVTAEQHTCTALLHTPRGLHDVCFVFSEPGLTLREWRFFAG